MALGVCAYFSPARHYSPRKLDHKTLEEIRTRAVQRVQAGESPEAVIQTLGFTRSCIYEWLARYRAGGWAGLKAKALAGRPESRGAAGTSSGVFRPDPRCTHTGRTSIRSSRPSPPEPDPIGPASREQDCGHRCFRKLVRRAAVC